MKRTHTLLGACALALTLALGACVGTTEPTQTATGFIVGPGSAVIAVGDTVRITAYMAPPDLVPGGLASVQWSSSDVQVATVAKGLVKGVGPGQATIVATAGQYHGASSIRVLGP